MKVEQPSYVDPIMTQLRRAPGKNLNTIVLGWAGLTDVEILGLSPIHREFSAAQALGKSTAEFIQLKKFLHVTGSRNMFLIALKEPIAIFGKRHPFLCEFGHLIDQYPPTLWYQMLRRESKEYMDILLKSSSRNVHQAAEDSLARELKERPERREPNSQKVASIHVMLIKDAFFLATLSALSRQGLTTDSRPRHAPPEALTVANSAVFAALELLTTEKNETAFLNTFIDLTGHPLTEQRITEIAVNRQN